jgi:catechol 2,3-dioxygenase-like lactoylglutathione lyase family enzyme
MTIFVRTKAIIVAACLIGASLVLAEAPSGAVVGACHISPIVSDLDRSGRFYRDLLGMDLMPAPAPGPLPWDTDPGHLDLHGLPNARLRFIQARMPGVRCGIELVEFAGVDRNPVRRRYQDPGAATIILMVRDIDSAFAALKNGGARIVTTGGAPIGMSTANRTRAVTVEDPDGHFVELAQIDPAPASTVARRRAAGPGVLPEGTGDPGNGAAPLHAQFERHGHGWIAGRRGISAGDDPDAGVRAGLRAHRIQRSRLGGGARAVARPGPWVVSSAAHHG